MFVDRSSQAVSPDIFTAGKARIFRIALWHHCASKANILVWGSILRAPILAVDWSFNVWGNVSAVSAPVFLIPCPCTLVFEEFITIRDIIFFNTLGTDFLSFSSVNEGGIMYCVCHCHISFCWNFGYLWWVICNQASYVEYPGSILGPLTSRTGGMQLFWGGGAIF